MTSPPRRPPQPGSACAQDLVVKAQHPDAAVLSQVIADAFFALPPSVWLIPDDAARRDIFPGYFRIYVEHAMESGTVHTTTDRAAAALWLPVSADGASPPGGYDEHLAAATGPWAGRFRAFDAALDRHHPAGRAHHHLAILAVRPDRQGQGTGSLLLRAYHDMLSCHGAPAYLEAATVRLTGLYQRHGYLLHPGAPFHLPHDGPAMWPMWREPQP
jgi:GNAT superfamily N-acetyltransferase